MTNTTATPIKPADRTVIIDVLRGFALFGVLLTNFWGLETEIPEAARKLVISSEADKLTDTAVYVLFLNKFITLFSLLFGYGFGVIIERTMGKGINPVPFFLRRMGVLFLAGLIHIGFWWGEILSFYALCGIFLLLFRKAKTETLLVTGLVCILVGGPAVQWMRLNWLPAGNPEPELTAYYNSVLNGSIGEVFTANYALMKTLFMDSWVNYRDFLEIFGKFLLGYYILRKGILKDISRQAKLVKRVWLFTLVIGALYILDKTLINVGVLEFKSKNLKLFEYIFNNAGTLSLSLFYATTIILLFLKHPGLKLFGWFREVGTMSLTNYLTHTLFYVFIFSGLGLGLLGRMPLYLILPLTIGIYSLQVLFSRFWMQRYLYGPCEWVWRQFTYFKRLPITRT